MALNGSPIFTFSPAISFFVNCQTQEEVDELWKKLSEGGEEGQYSWLDENKGGDSLGGCRKSSALQGIALAGNLTDSDWHKLSRKKLRLNH